MLIALFLFNATGSACPPRCAHGYRAVARSLGLKTLPEGLKEASQRAMLLELGCDLGQDYLSSCPQPAEAFAEKWLAAGLP